MSYFIVVDEPALKECVESNIYQSRHFDAGDALAKALSGDRSITRVSPRIVPAWHKDVLYLLQSRVETGYLLIDSAIFATLPQEDQKGGHLDDLLLVFQRICRFSIKEWYGLSLAYSEKGVTTTDCGVVFPFPKSKHTGYRISIKKGELTKRVETRHGSKQLFAFAGGEKEIRRATEEQERSYRRALEELSAARASVELQIEKALKRPADSGYHPLVLNQSNISQIRFQSYDDWIPRLTKLQRDFVESRTESPQRVEGPAGTGKTLCLMLRAYFLCKAAEMVNREFRVLFVSHSEATKLASATVFDSFGSPNYTSNTRQESLQSVELFTLQEWCGHVLGTQEITTAQFLDQDALAAKEMRKLIIKDVVQKRLAGDAKALEYLSPQCREFFLSESQDYIAELLQHEIGVMIKGRASQNIEAYLDLPPLTYCLPTLTPNDRRFIFSLYSEYQDDLNLQGVYDTDDIVLSTLGRLNTPIWRRRRAAEGFDAVVIDETHLFNFNELAVFHHLVRNPETPRIIFSIDRSQAPGERGITARLIREVLATNVEEAETKTQVVFRCSPNVVRLAEAITFAGATLFTTFENPLIHATSVITAADEEQSREAIYWKCTNDAAMCSFAVGRARAISNQLKCPVSDVVVIAGADSLLPLLRDAFSEEGVKYIEIVKRGDSEAVKRGNSENAFIISHPDYVGGLEFKAVLLVGVDEGRVPPSETAVRQESRHFVEFKACNRMYVSISRARLVVELFYSAERGKSPLLNHALATSAIVEKKCEI